MSTTGQRAKHNEGSLADHLAAWYEANARPLPWRAADVTAWHVLVSEFMLQQTQVDRVLPRYLEWVARWPRASSLAAESPGEAVRAWDRLGYPRRALWLHRAAVTIASEHADEVPRDIDALRALPGVGEYTARAVAVFAYGEHHPVVDTNTRRVIARAVHGRAAAAPPRASDLIDMAALLPERADESAVFNAAAMELGATVCTARAPGCDVCPIARWCEWRGAGYPENAPERRTRQATFAGSDRQVRGWIMAALRAAEQGLSRSEALGAATSAAPLTGLAKQDPEQPVRALDSLIRDGLVVEHEGRVRLP